MAKNQFMARLNRLIIPAGLLILGLFWLFWFVLKPTGIFSTAQRVTYLNQPLEKPEIWSISTDAGRKEQLTATGGKVVDFSVSADGKSIAYTVLNKSGGSDIWLVGSNGSRAHELVNCGEDICSQPAWSPSGKLIAYSRYRKSGESAGVSMQERIWTVNVKSGHTGSLFNEIEITGKSPVFSPNGNKLAFYDTSRQAIQFLDLRSGKSEFIPTQVEEVGTFSPDSTRMVFTDLQTDTLPPTETLFMVDMNQKDVSPLLNADSAIIDAANPTWSTSDHEIVFTARSSQTSGWQLWMVKADGSGLHAITDDVTADHAAARWSPDGTSLIFQQSKLGSSDSHPEIILWNQAKNQFTVLSMDGALPAWIR